MTVYSLLLKVSSEPAYIDTLLPNHCQEQTLNCVNFCSFDGSFDLVYLLSYTSQNAGILFIHKHITLNNKVQGLLKLI